jgi:hypothetical protein
MLVVLGLLPAAVIFGQTVTLKQLDAEKEGLQLINQLEDVARDVRGHADWLNVNARSTALSRWSHAQHLAEIKAMVNDRLGPTLQRLTEIQPQLPVWHQDTIDQMLASAKALAADTNSAILNQNEAGALPMTLNQEYQELVAGIDEHAEALVNTSDAAGDYATAHRQALEAGLRVPRH